MAECMFMESEYGSPPETDIFSSFPFQVLNFIFPEVKSDGYPTLKEVN